MTGTRNGIEDSQGCPPSASPVTPPEPASATPSETTAEAAGEMTAEPTVEAAAETHAVPLLEPRDGMPPLIVTRDALDDAVRWLAAGHGPVAVDADVAAAAKAALRFDQLDVRAGD